MCPRQVLLHLREYVLSGRKSFPPVAEDYLGPETAEHPTQGQDPQGSLPRLYPLIPGMGQSKAKTEPLDTRAGWACGLPPSARVTKLRLLRHACILFLLLGKLLMLSMHVELTVS